MTRVKLCGTTRESDLDAAVSAGADAVGVVVDVSVETPREVTPERGAELLDRLPPFVTGVLVTMPESVAATESLADQIGADAVQIHGQSAAETRRVAAAIDRPLLAAVDVTDDVAAYADHADAVLLDSTDAAGGGGTGEVHDWARARTIVEDLDVPVVLAGGLTPENVAEAVAQVDPFAVDVASGIERTGGVKDHDAMRRFTAAATRNGVDG